MKQDLIKLTERSKRGPGKEIEDMPVLVNREAIVLVMEAELELGGIPIIGQTKADNKIRQIMLTNGRSLFVTETLEEIYNLCSLTKSASA